MASEKLDEKAIFNVARKIESPDARAEYLHQVCGTDKNLFERVDLLMRAYEEQASFLELPPPGSAHPTIDQPALERPGTIIGPFKLLQQIGEGGMGVVYMAEQKAPVERRVALKIIKAGMDSRQVIARFEAERQALAMMDHPNIAKVFEAGTTESGRPYFVMELVKGIPITKYCDERRLSLKARLELMIPVCQAIQHAHQKGIIHRDLKPSNVLVAQYDGRPVPKVIDFGVAKATAHRLTERTMFTELGQVIGTLEYMSPEQAELNQLDIDTRSDIYSLGVLLYELLTGSTPFDKQKHLTSAFQEMLRIIREDEPSKPSVNLSTSSTLPAIAANRQTEPTRLSQAVRGELDWIVMKALEKDRNRRYETANLFAADIQRYLSDEAVQACPPSARYRFGKFARKNRATLTTTAVVALALLTGTVVSAWQAVRATNAQAQAHSEQQKALASIAAEAALRRRIDASERQAKDRLVEDEQQMKLALQEATIFQGEAKWPEALAAVKRAEVLLESRGASDTLQRRTGLLRQDLDTAFALENIRLRATAFALDGIRLPRDRKGYDLFTFHVNRATADFYAAFRVVGIDLESLDPAQAGELIRARSTRGELIAALDHLARLLTGVKAQQQTWSRLLQVARQADANKFRNQVRLAIERGDAGILKALAQNEEAKDLPPATLDLLADALGWSGDKRDAVALLREAQRRHPEDFWINSDLATMLPDHAERLRFFSAALASRPESPDAHISVGWSLMKLGKFDEAVLMCKHAIRLQPEYAHAHDILARCLYWMGSWDEAAAAYRETIRLQPNHLNARVNLSAALLAMESWDEAEAVCREAIRLFPTEWEFHVNLSRALTNKGLFAEVFSELSIAKELVGQGPNRFLICNNLAMFFVNCPDPNFLDSA